MPGGSRGWLSSVFAASRGSRRHAHCERERACETDCASCLAPLGVVLCLDVLHENKEPQDASLDGRHLHTHTTARLRERRSDDATQGVHLRQLHFRFFSCYLASPSRSFLFLCPGA